MYALRGLVLHLHPALANQGKSQGVNEPPVKNWFDISYNDNNAVLQGFDFSSDLGWVGDNTEVDPYSLYFNGASNNAIIENRPSFVPNEEGFTIEVWVNPHESGSILSYDGFNLLYDKDTSRLNARYSTTTREFHFSFDEVRNKQWVHLSLRFDGERLWGTRNAAPEGFSLPTEVQSNVPSSDLFIGSSESTDFFKGYIGLIRLYNRTLSFDEISTNYSSGLLIESDNSDLRSNGLILYRDELESELQVSITARVTAKYDITVSESSDIPSYLSVTNSDDMKGTLLVNPVTRLTARYSITNLGSDDLESNLEVTLGDDLEGNLKINPSTYLRSNYDIEEWHAPDWKSNIYVKYHHDLLSDITVNLNEIYMRSKYDIEEVIFSDLSSSINVNSVSELPSNIKVNTSDRMVARYEVEGITVFDLPSNINVRSTYNLPSSIKVNTDTYMSVRYGTLGTYINDLESSLVIPSTDDIESYLEIPMKSLLRSKYDIEPLYLYDIPSELGIKEFHELYGELFVKMETFIRSKYNVTPLYWNDTPSELTIRETSDLPSVLRLTPQGFMRANYELRERPKVTTTLYAVRDAYVRSYFSKINYGVESQMYTGYSSSPFPEVFRSLIGFDISSIPTDNIEVGKAVLRLFNDGRGGDSQELQITELLSQWEEYGVTWDSQPKMAEDGFNQTATIDNTSGKYIDIDVTSLVKAWHEGEKENFGFMLKALDEEKDLLKGFYTKDRGELRPELVVEYYDLVVYNIDDSILPSEVIVNANGEDDLDGKVDIIQRNLDDDLESHLKVKQPGDWESIIWINHPQIDGDLTVRLSDYSDVEGKLTVRVKNQNSLESNIRVNEKDKPSDIYVLYRDDIESSLTVRRWGEPHEGGDLESSIAVSEANKDSDIYILHRSDLPTNLDVRVWANEDDDQNNIPSDLEVTRLFELPSELEVKEKVQLDSDITVRAEDYDDQPSNVYVRFREDLYSYGNIGNPNLKGDISVWEKSILEGSLTVRQNKDSDLPSEIYVPQGDWSELPSTVNIRMFYDVPSHVTVRSGNLRSSLSIPMYGSDDLLGVISSRVVRVSDLNAYIGIASGNLLSEISVRDNGHQDTPSDITVSKLEESDLPIEGDVLYRANLFSTIAINKFKYRNLGSSISVRRSSSDDLESTLSVRLWGDPDNDGGQLEGSVDVRVDADEDWDSDLTVRQSDLDDLESTILVKQVSDLVSSISIRQVGSGDLESTIFVYEHFELGGLITVRRWGDPDHDGGQIPSDITVRQSATDSLDSYVEIYRISDIEGAITVRQRDQDDLNSTVSIRVVDHHDQPSSISARQKDVGDLPTYVFAVRRDSLDDLPSDGLIKRVSDLESHVEVVTAYPYVYIM